MVLTKTEIDIDIQDKGDFVKLDHLKRFLPKVDSLDVKKYILLKLAEINESHGFFSDAAKNVDMAADVVASFKEKIDLYMKEVLFLIKSEQFDLADKTLLKALAFVDNREVQQIKDRHLSFYLDYAKKSEEESKHRKAIDAYNRIYSIEKSQEKKLEIKQKLLELYIKTGRTGDYNRLMNLSGHSSVMK